MRTMLSAVRPPFSWTSLEGRTIIREIIKVCLPQWRNGPTGPKATQLNAGLRRFRLFFLHRRGAKSPSHQWVTPLIGLGNTHISHHSFLIAQTHSCIPFAHQAREVSELGLRALSLNAETLQLAAKNGCNVIDEIEHCLWEIIFLSAERLASPEIDKLSRDNHFRCKLILLGIDEAHLLPPCGKEFRKPTTKSLSSVLACQIIVRLLRLLPPSQKRRCVSRSMS